MPADLFVPDNLTLRLFLLGQLSGPEADRVERYLETHPESARTLHSLSGDDTFTSALRDQGLAEEVDPEVHAAVARMERLLTELGERTTTRDDVGDSRPDRTEAGEDTEDGLQFLAPAQGPDELGRLGGYRVLRVLGRGGMGMVLEADDPKLGRRVAIKVMRPRVATSPNAVRRFLQEARAAAAVEHDHIIPIWYIGEDNGVPYIVMPFLKGQSLNARLNREDRLPPSEIIRIGVETAEGLAAAHEKGLVHRDIKPANLWLEAPRGRVKVLDFGLARVTSGNGQLTQSGAIVGTPAYMAPEQGRGQGVDARSDLFSLGAVLYRMATGRNPFAGTDTMSLLTSLATDTPTDPRTLNPDLPPHLADLIVRLLQKDPAARPQSAREVIALLAPPPAEAMADSGERRAEFAFDDDDATQVEDPRAATAEPDVRTDWRSRGRGLTKGGIVIALMALIGVTVATFKLVFETKDGTLVVEISDNETEARFKNGKLELVDADGKVKYTLEPGERNKKVAPGVYEVKVIGADGVELTTPEFTMKKGGQVVVRVTAKGPAGVAGKDPPASGDPDRKAAEYVLLVGGAIRIIENGKEGNPRVVGELPAGPFELRIADLTHSEKANDAGLASFKDCKNLTHLFLNGTSVSDAGLAHLRDCKNLTLLTLKTTRVTAQGVGEVKKALPNCKIEWDDGGIGPPAADPSFFNGRDLTGWTSTRGLWRVADGAIVGSRLLKSSPGADLYSARKFTDFELSFQARGGAASAGVLFRAAVVNDGGTPIVKGPRCGLGAQQMGLLVGDSVGGGPLKPGTGVPARGPDQFNDLTIRCVRKRVTITVNGTVTVDGEHDLPSTGVIAWHIRGTEDAVYRNIRFVDLSKPAPAALPLFNGKDLTGWVSRGTFFRVADGVVVATQPAGALANKLVNTERAYRDFELFLRVRLKGGIGSVGVVVRAEVTELQKAPLMVGVKGPRWFLTSNMAREFVGFGNPRDGDGSPRAGLRKDVFNDVRIRCVGNRLTVTVNGTTGIDRDLDGMAPEGVIVLSVGPNIEEATFADVRLAELSPPKAVAEPDRAAAEWVLAAGGKVRVNGGPEVLGDRGKLPAGPFRLTAVQLAGSAKVTDAGLAALKGCVGLAAVGLEDTTVGDGGMDSLAGSKALTHLYVQGSRVGDAGLAKLKDCPNLLALGLGKTAITDAAVATLAGFNKLQFVDVTGTRVSKTGVANLAMFLPLCKIVSDHGTVEGGREVPDFFNGKDLTGWVVTVGRLWAVKDGALTGIAPKVFAWNLSKTVYTARSYRDFQLSCEIRRKGGGGHAVIHFRGALPTEGDGLIGGRWVLRSSGQTLTVEAEDGAESDPHPLPDMKANDFNPVVIRVVGRRVTVTLNGKVGYDKELAELSDVGAIGFRFGGPLEEVTFRNFRLVDLSPAKAADKK